MTFASLTSKQMQWFQHTVVSSQLMFPIIEDKHTVASLPWHKLRTISRSTKSIIEQSRWDDSTLSSQTGPCELILIKKKFLVTHLITLVTCFDFSKHVLNMDSDNLVTW